MYDRTGNTRGHLDRPQEAKAMPGAQVPRLQFPTRTSLHVREVAERLKVTQQHVCDLIEEGTLQAINVGGKGTRKKAWRIPVESYEAFVKNRLS